MLESLRLAKRRVMASLRLSRALSVTRRQAASLPGDRRVKRHGLAGRLVVSLTSYPKRYPVLYGTIVNLLSQSLRADEVVLWLAEQDRVLLPSRVEALCEHGLVIRTCPDYRSYKKLAPQLELSPDAFIVVADDDVYYDPNWLARLVDSYDPADRSLVAHRARLIKRSASGELSPYSQWPQDIVSKAPGVDVFATGVGGVLYPPGSLAPEATDASLFMALCPRGDDIWFHWMARRTGVATRTTARRFIQVAWPQAEETGLMHDNWAGGNDRQLAAMVEAFGLPGATITSKAGPRTLVVA